MFWDENSIDIVCMNFSIEEESNKKYIDELKNKIAEQKEVYYLYKAGDCSLLENKIKNDDNHINRLRLCYYILYTRIHDIKLIEYLFNEELKDSEIIVKDEYLKSFQILAYVLNKYNINHKYDYIFEKLKNNYNYFFEYDKNSLLNENILSLNLIDCIYIAKDLDYKEVMEKLVNKWKENIDTFEEIEKLIEFNAFLGIENSRETIDELLAEAELMEKERFYSNNKEEVDKKIINCRNNIIKKINRNSNLHKLA